MNYRFCHICALILTVCLLLCSCSDTRTVALLGDQPATAPTLPTAPIAPTEPTQPEDFSHEPRPGSDYSAAGVFESDTGTGLILRMAWEAEQRAEEDVLDLTVRVYLVFDSIHASELTDNMLMVNGERVTFTTPERASALQ